MKYDAYWCVVHNSEYDHHNLFLAHSIFLLFFRSFSSLRTSIASISLTLSAPFFSVTLYFASLFFSPSHFLSLDPISSPSPPSTSLCSLSLDTLCYPRSLMPSTFPPSSFQVRGSQQGLFSSSADARCPGEGLGHVGRLPGEHLRQGPSAPFGSLRHYLLPPRMPPSKREQVTKVPSKGDKMGKLERRAFVCIHLSVVITLNHN